MQDQGAISGGWTGGEGELEGRPVMVRWRSFEAVPLDPTLSTRVSVLWSYDEVGDSGMPGAEDSAAMTEFEDLLIEALEFADEGRLAFVFTHAGQREWCGYVSDLDALSRRFNQAMQGRPRLPLRLAAEADPDWRAYRAITDRALEG